MEISFKEASALDAETIGRLVVDLTNEICAKTDAAHFDIEIDTTIARCRRLIEAGHYTAIIGFLRDKPVAVATIAESYALYANGKIGIIQEFYVTPDARASGVGTLLLSQVKAYGKKHQWSCLELCTPPLPAFERTLNFYEKNNLTAVGGRKMRQSLSAYK